jgi:NADH dehydrogenase
MLLFRVVKVVVAGCGIAGAEFLRHFPGEAIVVSPEPNLVCQALFPAYIAGKVEDSELSIDLIPFFESRGISYYPNKVSAINTKYKTLFTKASILRDINYDFAVIAVGGENCTYGIKGVEKALSFNDFKQARKTKKRIEHANKVVVVGSGITGVETAYELADKYKITIIEARNRVLPAMCEKASLFAKRLLEKSGVNVVTSCKVEKIEKNEVFTSRGRFEFDEILWCAGIRGRRIPGLRYNRSGIKVDESLRADQNVFAIGDCADVKVDGDVATKTALEAERQAKFVAKIIAKSVDKSYRPFSTVNRPFAIITFGNRGIIVKGSFVLTLPQGLIYRLKRKIIKNFFKKFKV